ncbi:proline dehydrogenase [Dyadobacter luteus]|uniref:Proline dehydrogenase n=1 Tax=Dyadobacter luteus TaxID=2259619 RepID=A0A3D8YB08_9BACT|nr:proline dehydrogenase family protein [Dyadobacter luteus]REA60964.1 proline dehydrogenase [Dyadobacter luteus]
MEKIFNDTRQAFAYKTNGQLRKAYWLFKMMKYNWLISIGTDFILKAIEWRLPVKGLLKNTLYSQFVGGETLETATPAIKKLDEYDVDVILDYGAEAKEGEDNFDLAREEFIKAIGYASSQKSIPFISLKITALARFELLEKVNPGVVINETGLLVDLSLLTSTERQEWERVLQRTFAICDHAGNKGVGVLIDAEESWIQDSIDAVVMMAMERFNKNRVVVYNTIQLYRHDKLLFLKQSAALASARSYTLAVKLVRGAYMEKERARAQATGSVSPIQPNKNATDQDFNRAVEFCLAQPESIATVVATHNEDSNMLALDLLKQDQSRRSITFFSQLYGMSDNITFNLAKAGFKVSKYLPYGSVEDVIPYLLRRAQENSSVAGQTGRELFLLTNEMKRRGL